MGDDEEENIIWQIIKANPQEVSVEQLRNAIREVNDPGVEGTRNENGFWQTIVTAILNPSNDAVREILTDPTHQARFAELKDQFGPDDLILPTPREPAGAGAGTGGKRRRHKTRRRRTAKRKSTRRRRQNHHRGA